MVDGGTQVTGLEEMNTVQVRDVNSACVWLWALRAIFLHMHSKETHIHSINLFKSKHGFCTVWKGLRKHSSIIPNNTNQKNMLI